jgi:gas vesicle protein
MPVVEFLTGIVVGLIIAPLLFIVVGMFGYTKKSKRTRAKINDMQKDHKKDINKIKKEYEKKHNNYMKLRTKIIKFVDTKLATHDGVEE